MRGVFIVSVTMSQEKQVPRSLPPVSPEARELLSRLYREIGLAAVAAALETPVLSEAPRRPSVRDIPVVLRGVDRAA